MAADLALWLGTMGAVLALAIAGGWVLRGMRDRYRAEARDDDFRDGMAAYLGKRVRVTLDQGVVAEGVLLGFGDGGEFEIRQDDGMVYHAWPMLAVEEVPGA